MRLKPIGTDTKVGNLNSPTAYVTDTIPGRFLKSHTNWDTLKHEMAIGLLQVFLAGFQEIQTHFSMLILIGGVFWGLGQWSNRLLPSQKLSLIGRLGLQAGLGCSWLACGSTIIMMVGRVYRGFIVVGSILVLIFAVIGIYQSIARKAFLIPKFQSELSSITMVFILVVVRLAFLQDMLMPPYYDSPEHYRLIESLLAAQGKLTEHYYHLGFHSISAVFVTLSGDPIGSVMLLLGQSLLILAPFTVMGLLEIVTDNFRLSWFSALLVGFGWSMPAFAANWGKYPAIAALAVLPAVLLLLHEFFSSSKRSGFSWLLTGFALVGIFLLHTRAMAILIIVVLAWVLISKFQMYLLPNSWFPMIFLLPGVFALWSFRGALEQLYCGDGCILILVVCLLLPFASYYHPRISSMSCLILLGIWMASNLLLPPILNYYSRTLLDRTFVEISLYLPLSVIGAAGMKGILSLFKTPLIQKSLSTVLVCLALGSFSTHPVSEPDRCCNYVHSEDIEAMQWIRTQTTPDAVIVIPSFQSRNYRIGTDAGSWVEVLSGRNVRKRSYALDWSTKGALRQSCEETSGDVYAYAGSMPFSFKWVGMDLNDSLRLVYWQGDTRIYQITGCQEFPP
jgi:hypothetical protein